MTLTDVAEYAGVSASTASRALNGRGELSAATRAAVLEAADILHFEPSLLARSLRTRTTWTVGFVVPDVSSPFYAAALKGAQARARGFRLPRDADGLGPGAGRRARRPADAREPPDRRAAASPPSASPPSSSRSSSPGAGRPCIFFDSVLAGAGEGSVLLDNAAGIDLLVDHLADTATRGSRLLAGSLDETSGHERLDAFDAAMRRTGSTFGRLRRRRPLVERRRRARTRARSSPLDPRPTAIVASSAELALGCMLACRELGVSLPGRPRARNLRRRRTSARCSTRR